MTSPEIDSIPTILKPLAILLQDVPVDDSTLICRWMGIPTPDECPTPGQARTWKRGDWDQWSKEHGFDFAGETTHSWSWKHRVANSLVLAVAKTPGDFRTPMAMATQTRRMVRDFALLCNSLLRSFCSGKILPPEGTEESWKNAEQEDVRRIVVGLAQDRSRDGASLMVRAMTNHIASKGSKTLQDYINVLMRIQKDFGISPVDAVARITSKDLTDKGMGWDRLKLMDPMVDMPAEFIDQAKDLLEELRETERAEKEIKREEREREIEERERRKNEKTRPKTARELLQQSSNARDDVVKKGITAAIGAAMSTLDRLRMLESSIKPLEIPEVEDPEPLRRELDQANRNLEDLKVALVAQTQSRQEALDQIVDLTKKMTPERLVHLEQVEENLSVFAAMVVESIHTAQNANSFQLVNLLNSLSDQAKTFIKKA